MFAVFAQESGFKHKQVTPLHPKVQGQVEGFNKMVNKAITITRQEDKNHVEPHETRPRNTLKMGNAVIVKHENKRKSQRPYEPYITLSKQLTMNFCRKYRKRDREMSLSRNSADKNVTMVNFFTTL